MIKIRPVEEKDLTTILAIYNDVILTSTAVYKYQEETMAERKAWLMAKEEAGLPVIVYEEAGEVLGFATYGSFRPYPAFKYSIEHSVYVHKDHHSKGIGTKLMKELIKLANTAGFKMMIAGIDASNIGSIRAHEKLGFTYAGTIKKSGFKFGHWLDLAFYQLELDGPTEPTED